MLALLWEKRDFFGGLLWEHLQISLTAVLLAVVIGLVLGIAISEYQGSAKMVLGAVNFIYTIPSISLLGFLIPFSGIGNPTAIIALTVYGLLPMVRNTYTGITTIDPLLIEAATGMGSTRWQILYKIKLPLALPMIMSGLRNMATMTIALAGIASFIGAGGLGVAIYRGITTNNSAMTMAGSLLIALLALLVDALLGKVEKTIKGQKRVAPHKRRVIYAIAAALLLVAVAGGILAQLRPQEAIRLATKPMTEQYIIGAMLKEVIEDHTDLQVELVQGVGGGTSNIMPGMQSGEFDMYPEYTATGWNMVLGHEGVYQENQYEELKQEYAQTYDMQWTTIFGFNDSYGLAVRREIAEQYHLRTYSDLQAVAGQLTFGGEYDFFERPDGYDGLCAHYGLDFRKTMDLDIGLKYQAMSEGKVDVMDIFTTDGQLAAADVVVLEDDRQYFSSAMAALVVRNVVLERYPQLTEALAKLENILDDDQMAQLNYLVESGGQEAEQVAHDFLLQKQLVGEE